MTRHTRRAVLAAVASASTSSGCLYFNPAVESTQGSDVDSADRFLVDVATYNDSRGVFLLDAVRAGETLVTSFEGDVDWSVERIGDDDYTAYGPVEVANDRSVHGDSVFRYEYGEQPRREAGGTEARLELPFSEAASGPFSVWASIEQRPEDDFSVGFTSAELSDDRLFSFNLNRETTRNVHVLTPVVNHDTGFRPPSGTLFQYTFDEISWEEGRVHYRIQDGDGAVAVDGTVEFW